MDQFGFQTVYTQYNPHTFVAHSAVWNAPIILGAYDKMMEQNRPVTLTILNTAAPITGTNDPLGLQKTIDYLSGKGYRLDFLNTDIEFSPEWSTAPQAILEVAEAVRQVRTHADPNINQAIIGQFGAFPVSTLEWASDPQEATPAKVAAFNAAYFSMGVNVAMPTMYGWEYYSKHAFSSIWGSNVAPNTRSAMFWGSLAQYSNAKINLPAGHLIIPYMNDFVSFYPDTSPYNAPTPPHEDSWTLLKHARLRGADGYFDFATLSESEPVPYDNDKYRGDLIKAWDSLEWLFPASQTPTILNLTTDKQSGLQWSGVYTNRGAAVLVSNLGNSAVQFTMPNVPGYNDQLIDSFTIAAGEHRLEYYFQAPSGSRAVTVLTPSFETPANGDDGYYGWPVVYPWTKYEGGHTGYGAYNPLVTEFDGADGNGTPDGADGKQVLTIFSNPPAFYDADTGYHNSISQILDEDLKPGIYKLTIAVGMRDDADGSTIVPALDWEFSLSTEDLGGMYSPAGYGNPLMVATGAYEDLPEWGKFYDQELIYVVTPTNTHIGEKIRIDLGANFVGYGDFAYFDNVRLTYYTTLVGDANCDGVVDAADAGILAANWLSTDGVGWCQGDFNEDGVVDTLDATMMATNWTGTGAVVPEPSTLMLLTCGLVGLVVAKFRKV